MAELQIGDLAAGTPAEADVFEFDTGAVSNKVALSLLRTSVLTAPAAAGLSLIGAQTSGNGATLAITDGTRTGGAGALQLGVTVAHALNQTGTAAFTSLDIVRTETAVGSGAQYLINAKAGAAGATQVFAVTNAGQVFAGGNGAAATPSLSFLAFPTNGFNAAAGVITVALAGTQYFKLSVSGSTTSFQSVTATTDFYVSNSQSNTTARMVLYSQAGGDNTYSIAQVCQAGGTVWTGSSVTQLGFGIYHGVNQTSTASFIALDINVTATALGAGSTAPVYGSAGGAAGRGGFALRVREGGTSPTEYFALNMKGGSSCAAVSPATLANGNVDNYAGAAGYGLARLTPDPTASVIRGILAPVPVLGAILTLINLGNGAGTLTVNNQDAGSAAANRIQTTTGAATVIATNGIMRLQYDPTSAFWRQI